MTQPRLFRSVRLICILATLAVPGLQTVTFAQTAIPRGPSQTQPRLRLGESQSAAQPAGERMTHVIQRGETLWSIARRYSTTVASVQQWNKLRGSVIQVGRQLTIFTAGGPVAPPAPAAASVSASASGGERVTHVIQRGETLTSIARRYSTTVAAVQQWNKLRGSVIQPGRQLTIFTAGGPTAPPAPGTAPARVSSSVPAPALASSGERVTHVVQRGETLSSIARLYGISVAAVKGANGLGGDVILIGRPLTIFTSLPGAQWAASMQGLRFRVNEQGDQVPDLRAEAAIVYNPATGQVLWEENSQNQRSIASITKVMTAVVFLEGSPDLSREVEIERSDVTRASVTYLRAGYKVTTGDLLHLLLIPSDNAAARALARVSPQGSGGFVERMNEKAAELGLTNTHYADPSGLVSENVSSAYDMARLMAYAGGDERIAGLMQKQRYDVHVGRRTIPIHSTNQLVMKGDVDVLGGKTGFIRKAGYCLATLLRLPEGGPPVVVVVLGARSSASRFLETRQLFNWITSRAHDLLVAPVQAAAVPSPSLVSGL